MYASSNVCDSVYLSKKKKKGAGGDFLSISMHLLQIVSIYLFIFPRSEKKIKMCARTCVCVRACVRLVTYVY